MTKQLIIFGDSAFAEIAYEYFTFDSDYEVVAFTVSREFLTKDTLFGLPVVPFDEIENLFPPQNALMFVALIYNEQNTIRERFYNEAKQKGYKLASYVSTKSFVWRNVSMGDNCFIFENNTVQPFVSLGCNNILWSGNHIGHHSTIGDHNFISSHVVLAGFTTTGDNCFFGINSTIVNNLTIGSHCFIGSGSHIVRNIENGKVVNGLFNRSMRTTEA